MLALAAAGSGLVQGLLSYQGVRETNAANKDMQAAANNANEVLARENREWQERMANTAHKRQVADLRAAGLNPILSATGGSGAASPSSAPATHNAARMENALGAGVSSALQSMNLHKELEMADSQKALNASAVQTQATQQSLNASNAAVARETALNKMQEYRIGELNEKSKSMSNEAQEAGLAALKEQAQADLKRARVDNKMATFDAVQKRVDNALDTAGSAKDLINPFKGLFSPKSGPKSAPVYDRYDPKTWRYKDRIRDRGN